MRPWWQFWATTARPGEVEAALVVLCDYPSPAVTARARQLAAHRDPRVANAARFLLERDSG